AAEHEVRFDDSAQTAALENVNRGSAGRVLNPLGAGLRCQVRSGSDGLIQDLEFFKLVDERFLAVNMFTARQRRRHDAAVGVIWCGNDHSVELVAVLVEGLAIIGRSEGFWMVLGGLGYGGGIHVAQADDVDIRVRCNLLAVRPADRADDPNRKHTKLCVGRGSEQSPSAQGNGAGGGGVLEEPTASEIR